MNRTICPEIKTVDAVNFPETKLLQLPNGVPLYAINAGEQDVVKIELMFKAGKWYESKNLIADFANRMMREGTTSHSAKEIADTFDYYGANVQYSTGFENAGVTLYSMTKQAEKLLPLLKEILTEATFPQAELDLLKNNREQRLKVDLEKNDFIANRQFVSALYGQKHPYGRVTELEDFKNIERSDLLSFYKQYYHPRSITIIVSGKFDESLLKSIHQHFGSEPLNDTAEITAISHPIESSSELIHHTEKTDSVQSAILIGNICINKQHPDFMKVSVMNTLFGGYFGSRLMTNIREDKGYTYGIYSSFVSYTHGGFFEISAEVGKDVKEATMKEIAHEINRMRTEPIGKEELQIVKNYLSGKIMRSIDGPLKFSETLKGLIIYGQNTGHIHEFLKTVKEISADEILALAVKYLDYDKMYKVTVG